MKYIDRLSIYSGGKRFMQTKKTKNKNRFELNYTCCQEKSSSYLGYDLNILAVLLESMRENVESSMLKFKSLVHVS